MQREGGGSKAIWAMPIAHMEKNTFQKGASLTPNKLQVNISDKEIVEQLTTQLQDSPVL